jgi:hypothetical protein
MCEIRLVGAHVRTTTGWPHGSLGYESKCWAGFDSQFDKLMNHIGVDKRGFKEGVQGDVLNALSP